MDDDYKYCNTNDPLIVPIIWFTIINILCKYIMRFEFDEIVAQHMLFVQRRRGGGLLRFSHGKSVHRRRAPATFETFYVAFLFARFSSLTTRKPSTRIV